MIFVPDWARLMIYIVIYLPCRRKTERCLEGGIVGGEPTPVPDEFVFN